MPCIFRTLTLSMQGRSGVVTDKGGRLGSPGRVGSAGDKGPDVPGSPGSCSGFGPRELKALEGLSPVEARQLMTSLVDDITAAGIGEMVLKEEASKQVCLDFFKVSILLGRGEGRIFSMTKMAFLCVIFLRFIMCFFFPILKHVALCIVGSLRSFLWFQFITFLSITPSLPLFISCVYFPSVLLLPACFPFEFLSSGRRNGRTPREEQGAEKRPVSPEPALL